MSNNQMVLAPRELLERLDLGKNTAVAIAALPELRELLAKPAEQHQGEPVVLPERRDADSYHNRIGRCATAGMLANEWNACLDELAKLGPLYTRPAQGDPVTYQARHSASEPWFFTDKPGYWEWRPLYTHADPAEVEQLRSDFDECDGDRWKLRTDRDTLRAQLAERDALLRMVYLDEGTTDEKCARVEQIISASAEPSAPFKCRNECEDCGDDGQTCTGCAALSLKQ